MDFKSQNEVLKGVLVWKYSVNIYGPQDINTVFRNFPPPKGLYFVSIVDYFDIYYSHYKILNKQCISSTFHRT